MPARVVEVDDEEFVRRARERFDSQLRVLIVDYRRHGRMPVEVLGDPAVFADRALAAEAPVLSEWDALVGPFVRSEGVQARLGITRQAVASKAARRRLLRVVTADEQMLFPVWQFRDRQVVPGLAEVIALFPEDTIDGWTVAAWLRTVDAELGEEPLAALEAGRLADVKTVARSASAALAG